jgi:threonine aldolase
LGFHLDGARLFNAAVASHHSARDLAAPFDSVSICFSKGLGAPIGSMLLGTEALVGRARRWRKVLGGGWRQAGVVAAMAAYALDHNVGRLADDHRRAAALADALRALPDVAVDGPHTNMVFVTLPGDRVEAFAAHAQAQGLRLALRGCNLRMVLHLDIDDAGLARAIEVIDGFFRRR